MKKLWIFLALSFASFGCDNGASMCSVDEDCINLCRAYDGNALLYQCRDEMCLCVARESLACSEDDKKNVCTEICDKYRPGTVGVCEDSFCTCSEPESDDDSSKENQE